MNMMLFKGLLQLAYTLFHISQPFRTLHDLAPEHPLAPVVIQPLERPTLLYSLPHSSFLLAPTDPRVPPWRNHLSKSLALHVRSDSPSSWICSLLMLSGDLETNPGPRPAKFPCGVCSRACRKGQAAIQCDTCDTWIHKNCVQISDTNFNTLSNVSWHCLNPTCCLPNFSSTLFDDYALEILTRNSFEALSEKTPTRPVPSSPLPPPPHHCSSHLPPYPKDLPHQNQNLPTPVPHSPLPPSIN